jgi:NTE family protein
METLTVNTRKESEDTILDVETVLVLQGGGSLGAYECGVYKALANHNIKFDIVSGTSIGAINAAIIASHSRLDSAKELEKFWLELAEVLLPLSQEYSSLFITDEIRAWLSSMYSTTFGNPKAFFPVWIASLWRAAEETSICNYLNPFRPLPYPLFDIAPLKKTLSRYVDFTKVNNSKSNSSHNSKYPRLIVTSTDVKTSEPVIFDSSRTNIELDDVIASAGFPFYGISWTKQNGRYLWDGALLSSTPLREVIEASPILDKIVYLVNIFPHYQKELPQDIFQAWHRARDIMYTDKTDNNIRLSKIISRYLSLLNEFHDLLTAVTKNNYIEYNASLRKRFTNIEKEYRRLALQRGAIIKEIIRIERPEKTHFLFEDADFSITTIKKLIRQGERDAEVALAKKNHNDTSEHNKVGQLRMSESASEHG